MPDQKDDYPKMPAKQWWSLRNRFKQSIPGAVTASYLATILGMEEISASKNVLPALKKIGLIDQEGKPLDLARRWRDDDEYPKVCEEIKKGVYPSELLDAVPDPVSNRASAVRWFSRGGAGASLVDKRVAFYQLLSEADPTKSLDSTKPSSPNKTASNRATTPKKVRPDSLPKGKSTPDPVDESSDSGSLPRFGQRSGMQKAPNLHIDIQIHISPDASPDQIDQIFESMAKHLYNSGIGDE